MRFQRSLHLQILPAVGLIIVLFFLGGCATMSSTLQDEERDRTPVVMPTFTPTPEPVLSLPEDTLGGMDAVNYAALIDELGLDFAERRVTDLYERVSPRSSISRHECCAVASSMRPFRKKVLVPGSCSTGLAIS